jgi:hypothetical protein
MPPAELKGLKRIPRNIYEADAPRLRSEKLGRMVACESTLELRVMGESSPSISEEDLQEQGDDELGVDPRPRGGTVLAP